MSLCIYLIFGFGTSGYFMVNVAFFSWQPGNSGVDADCS